MTDETPTRVVLGPWKMTCTAKSKSTGNQCKKWAVPGSNVCSMHGAGGKRGQHPTSKHNPAVAAANRHAQIRERLETLAETAAATVEQVMMSGDKDSDKLKAAEMVLDRVVGRKIETERADQDELDLDAEIFEELGVDPTTVLAATGTDDEAVDAEDEHE